MKLSFACLFILVASILIIPACKKKETPNPQPAPTQMVDASAHTADLQKAQDISFATMAICDMDMMCAQIGGAPIRKIDLGTFFYLQKKDSALISIIADSLEKGLVVAYNTTSCIDGRKRDGSVFFYYGPDPNTNPNTNLTTLYYPDSGFTAKIIPVNYVVDGWRIELFNSSLPAYIINNVSPSTYDPAQTNLTWEINGKFKLTNLVDESRNLIWEGKIIKTLTNTNDPAVFAADKKSPVKWNLAKVNYTGTIRGIIEGTVPFTYAISNTSPLVRDFNCSFVPSGSTGVTQFHPIISGIATYTASNYQPQTINFGPNQDCDNKGTISFQGPNYIVDFE